MSVAQAEVVEKKAGHSDGEDDREIGVVGGFSKQGGEIPPTGKRLEANFCGIYEFDDGKITSFNLYFDQAELFTQLGITVGG